MEQHKLHLGQRAHAILGCCQRNLQCGQEQAQLSTLTVGWNEKEHKLNVPQRAHAILGLCQRHLRIQFVAAAMRKQWASEHGLREQHKLHIGQRAHAILGCCQRNLRCGQRQSKASFQWAEKGVDEGSTNST
jgi:hypothetical protein